MRTMSWISPIFIPAKAESNTGRFPQALAMFLSLALVPILNCTGLTAQTEAIDTALQADATAQTKIFEYTLEGRPDPFVPFITEKAATSSVDMNEIVDDNKRPLTGMQLFEPGQLNLVALMKNGNQDIAMVEDFTGKGYILTEGTLIGRRGVVKDIALNKVLIEETAYTRAGKKIVTEVVMLLKKEGEE
jgi:Tfp pilus assembly protein PilP